MEAGLRQHRPSGGRKHTKLGLAAEPGSAVGTIPRQGNWPFSVFSRSKYIGVIASVKRADTGGHREQQRLIPALLQRPMPSPFPN